MNLDHSDVKTFSRTSNGKPTKTICDFLKMQLSTATIENFSDGEIGIQIGESVWEDDLFIVDWTNFPANDNYLELLILVHAAKRASASRITAVIPCFGYARQDGKDNARVPLTAKSIVNFLVAAGTDRILSMDIHSQQLVGLIDLVVDHLFAASLLIKYLRNADTNNLTICSPDFGSAKMAIAYADALGCQLALFGKCRSGRAQFTSRNIIGEIAG
jgi:ribose-phosphate pyrophosphokinase